MDGDHEPVQVPGGGELLHGLDALMADLSPLSGELRAGEPLSAHTTIGIGGPASAFFLPETVDSLVEAVRSSRERDVPYLLLGGGSNILFSDRGYRGLVISTVRLTRCDMTDDRVSADCGLPLSSLISEANAWGIHSLDFLAGIPGTLGGALAMNAGIPARSIGDVVENVVVLSSGDYRSIPLEKGECGFSYRRSGLLQGRIPVLGARLRLDGEAFDREEILAHRTATQPVGFQSAGCAFRNPIGRSAGELIELAGLKGFRVGMAKVSDIHANFIINLDEASSAEIRRLIDIVRQKVYKSFHILLDLEIEVVDG